MKYSIDEVKTEVLATGREEPTEIQQLLLQQIIPTTKKTKTINLSALFWSRLRRRSTSPNASSGGSVDLLPPGPGEDDQPAERMSSSDHLSQKGSSSCSGHGHREFTTWNLFSPPEVSASSRFPEKMIPIRSLQFSLRSSSSAPMRFHECDIGEIAYLRSSLSSSCSRVRAGAIGRDSVDAVLPHRTVADNERVEELVELKDGRKRTVLVFMKNAPPAPSPSPPPASAELAVLPEARIPVLVRCASSPYVAVVMHVHPERIPSFAQLRGLLIRDHSEYLRKFVLPQSAGDVSQFEFLVKKWPTSPLDEGLRQRAARLLRSTEKRLAALELKWEKTPPKRTYYYSHRRGRSRRGPTSRARRRVVMEPARPSWRLQRMRRVNGALQHVAKFSPTSDWMQEYHSFDSCWDLFKKKGLHPSLADRFLFQKHRRIEPWLFREKCAVITGSDLRESLRRQDESKRMILHPPSAAPVAVVASVSKPGRISKVPSAMRHDRSMVEISKYEIQVEKSSVSFVALVTHSFVIRNKLSEALPVVDVELFWPSETFCVLSTRVDDLSGEHKLVETVAVPLVKGLAIYGELSKLEPTTIRIGDEDARSLGEEESSLTLLISPLPAAGSRRVQVTLLCETHSLGFAKSLWVPLELASSVSEFSLGCKDYESVHVFGKGELRDITDGIMTSGHDKGSFHCSGSAVSGVIVELSDDGDERLVDGEEEGEVDVVLQPSVEVEVTKGTCYFVASIPLSPSLSFAKCFVVFWAKPSGPSPLTEAAKLQVLLCLTATSTTCWIALGVCEETKRVPGRGRRVKLKWKKPKKFVCPDQRDAMIAFVTSSSASIQRRSAFVASWLPPKPKEPGPKEPSTAGKEQEEKTAQPTFVVLFSDNYIHKMYCEHRGSWGGSQFSGCNLVGTTRRGGRVVPPDPLFVFVLCREYPTERHRLRELAQTANGGFFDLTRVTPEASASALLSLLRCRVQSPSVSRCVGVRDAICELSPDWGQLRVYGVLADEKATATVDLPGGRIDLNVRASDAEEGSKGIIAAMWATVKVKSLRTELETKAKKGLERLCINNEMSKLAVLHGVLDSIGACCRVSFNSLQQFRRHQVVPPVDLADLREQYSQLVDLSARQQLRTLQSGLKQPASEVAVSSSTASPLSRADSTCLCFASGVRHLFKRKPKYRRRWNWMTYRHLRHLKTCTRANEAVVVVEIAPIVSGTTKGQSKRLPTDASSIRLQFEEWLGWLDDRRVRSAGAGDKGEVQPPGISTALANCPDVMSGRLLLHYACRYRDLLAVQTLLPHVSLRQLTMRDHLRRMTPFHLLVEGDRRRGSEDVTIQILALLVSRFKRLLGESKSDVGIVKTALNLGDVAGRSVANVAFDSGRFEVVRYIVDLGMADGFATNRDGVPFWLLFCLSRPMPSRIVRSLVLLSSSSSDALTDCVRASHLVSEALVADDVGRLVRFLERLCQLRRENLDAVLLRLITRGPRRPTPPTTFLDDILIHNAAKTLEYVLERCSPSLSKNVLCRAILNSSLPLVELIVDRLRQSGELTDQLRCCHPLRVALVVALRSGKIAVGRYMWKVDDAKTLGRVRNPSVLDLAIGIGDMSFVSTLLEEAVDVDASILTDAIGTSLRCSKSDAFFPLFFGRYRKKFPDDVPADVSSWLRICAHRNLVAAGRILLEAFGEPQYCTSDVLRAFLRECFPPGLKHVLHPKSVLLDEVLQAMIVCFGEPPEERWLKRIKRPHRLPSTIQLAAQECFVRADDLVAVARAFPWTLYPLLLEKCRDCPWAASKNGILDFFKNVCVSESYMSQAQLHTIERVVRAVEASSVIVSLDEAILDSVLRYRLTKVAASATFLSRFAESMAGVVLEVPLIAENWWPLQARALRSRLKSERVFIVHVKRAILENIDLDRMVLWAIKKRDVRAVRLLLAVRKIRRREKEPEERGEEEIGEDETAGVRDHFARVAIRIAANSMGVHREQLIGLIMEFCNVDERVAPMLVRLQLFDVVRSHLKKLDFFEALGRFGCPLNLFTGTDPDTFKTYEQRLWVAHEECHSFQYAKLFVVLLDECNRRSSAMLGGVDLTSKAVQFLRRADVEKLTGSIERLIRVLEGRKKVGGEVVHNDDD